MNLRNTAQNFHGWLHSRVGRFIVTQSIHSAITIAVLAILLFGAAKVGALEGVFAKATTALQQISFNMINYQGRLGGSDGNPLTGNYDLKFAIYDSPTGGSRLWPANEGYELHEDVPVSDGLFSVRLGQLTGGMPTAVFSGGDVWLEMMVETEVLSPREQLTAVPYAMQAGYAAEAATVPDGSITNAKLDLDGTLNLGGEGLDDVAYWTGSYKNFVLENLVGNIRLISAKGVLFFLDSNNDDTDASFRIGANQGAWVSPIVEVFRVWENGNIEARGTLNMHGNSVINQGAMVEANLQTPEELAAETIGRFSEGDVLCWQEERLEACAITGDPLVQAVADAQGKPIVIGAEVIKVVGPVQRGDLLVASDVPGYAGVDNNPQPGSVIAQALEDFDGERGLIKAMIRKF